MSGYSIDKLFWQQHLSKPGWENVPVEEKHRTHEEKKKLRRDQRLRIHARKTNNLLILDNDERNAIVDAKLKKLLSKRQGQN
ncbi:hypothetical protein WM40_12295 [Robbsia andropogonis]|uniref:Uncharacterized protein n=1 Tax=Robbsia andropogonis TaxID=28092 RepID=A0A0F5K148_9BURK|nr:hypothetical protein [Robbsia andropogonis]KKB63282.1 hypothetical protein WM40_12295 [Robbsia andropogonis]MCP1118221.1 hypothetical protein [Robbsia andropogonis]MCP1127498.1 hypothetical protein [Robbsia andropogonis]